MRGATGRPLSPCADTLRFQSTRPMRGATFYILPTMRARDISIHAPHAGRDAGDKYITGSNCISIHAPLAGCDVEHIQHTVWFSPYFNPRAPCGARQGDHLGGTPLRAISIHAPRAGRDDFLSGLGSAGTISIHAPRAGRDFQKANNRVALPNFNPRAPCGARQSVSSVAKPPPRISIHAPRAGRDKAFPQWLNRHQEFQSTRPVRGATGAVR